MENDSEGMAQFLLSPDFNVIRRTEELQLRWVFRCQYHKNEKHNMGFLKQEFLPLMRWKIGKGHSSYHRNLNKYRFIS
jgi:hypothetical protein